MGRTRQAGIALAALAACLTLGCSGMHVEAVSRPSLSMHGRVAIIGQLSRDQIELFLPLYMKAFPDQAVVERRDLTTVLTEQNLRPDRLRAETRAKLRRLLGVTAIVYPNFTATDPGQLSIKVIDTESGEIVAAILVTREVEPWLGTTASVRKMIYKGIDALRKEAARNPEPGWSLG
jgi:hypothetical protein